MCRVLLICCFAILPSVIAVSDDCDPHDYALVDWLAGVIVWQGQVPDGAANLVVRLEEAVSYVIDFWGFEVPAKLDGSRDPDAEFQVYDPKVDSTRIVPPLSWGGQAIPPIVVFAFPRTLYMRSALGDTSLASAFWVRYPLERVFPDSACWIDAPGSGYRNMLASQFAEMEILVHEFAHWCTFEWLQQQGICLVGIPDYIIEGIAEVTADAFQERHHPAETLGVVSWATRNCLPRQIEGVMRYSVGESLVGYLVERLGHEEFLATLRKWSNMTTEAIAECEAGWRESLGLAAECGEG